MRDTHLSSSRLGSGITVASSDLSSVALLRDLTLDSGDGCQRAISARTFRRSHPENPLRDVYCVTWVSELVETRSEGFGPISHCAEIVGLHVWQIVPAECVTSILTATSGVASISRIVLCYKTLPQHLKHRIMIGVM